MSNWSNEAHNIWTAVESSKVVKFAELEDKDNIHKMAARYDGRCKQCGRRIAKGERIVFAPRASAVSKNGMIRYIGHAVFCAKHEGYGMEGVPCGPIEGLNNLRGWSA
jgi:hypothetical protein